MSNEFTSWCSYYYELSMLLSEMEEHFQTLLDDAPDHLGQTNANEVDAIIGYCRMVQAEQDKIDKTAGKLWDAKYTVLTIMQHFEIPPGTVLTGEIPGEMSFEVWADGEDNVYVNKTCGLGPEIIPQYIFDDYVGAKLSEIHIFDEATKKAAYSTQTVKAKANGVSNCPYCAIGHDPNKNRIWKLDDMDADYVAALSNSGATTLNDCEMSCKPHNRLKSGM